MSSIATLTVNPAVDKNSRVEQVLAEAKLRCDRPSREPGGGGLNVARAIQRLGGTAQAYYTAGGPIGEVLGGLLAEEGQEHHALPVSGWTRENFIVYEGQSGQQYRFGMPGPELTEDEWRGCLERIETLEPAPDYLVASGSLPPGVPDDFYNRMARAAAQRGIRVVVDTSGKALRRGVQGHVFLVKPNVRELSELVGEDLAGEQQQLEAARALIEQGRCEVVVLSLGAGGALLITANGREHVRTPTVPIRSKVGAGDSMVAGIVLGLSRGLDLADAVRYGVAAGAAAVMTPGTELCRREDTERLFGQMMEDAQ
jgi:6-phosphofructokinase 2